MNIIYMSHPYTGSEEENRKSAREKQGYFMQRFIGECIINPIDTFVGMECNDNHGYCAILACCIELLSRCDKIVMCRGWEESGGCKAEYAFALKKGMVILFE